MGKVYPGESGRVQNLSARPGVPIPGPIMGSSPPREWVDKDSGAMLSDSDKALVDDLTLAEDARLLVRELGFAIALWEALRLARTERTTLSCEMERLQKYRNQGRSPSLGGLIIDSIEQIRKKLGPRARNYRDVLRSSNVAGDSVRLDLLAGLLAQHPALPTA